MTITLGGVTLNDHVSWRGKFNQFYPGREAMTLGGRVVVQRGPSEASEIILEAIEEDNVRKGFFTEAQLSALQIMKNQGLRITLSYHGESHEVVIKADGISVEKTLWKSQYTADERYVGSIILKKVS
jgi:hypothetical protein